MLVKNDISLVEKIRTSVLRNMMLWFSISVLLNTSFFPTIQRYMLNDLPVISQEDPSLLEALLENLLALDDPGLTFPQDADDTHAGVDYLLCRVGMVLHPYEEFDVKERPDNYDRPAYPTLQISTPPPKA